MIDRILYGGHILTLDERQPRVSALAIAGERIVACGDDESILALATFGTVKENLHGQFVMSGLTDAHIHWEGTSLALARVDVFEVPSKALAVERVRQRALTMQKGAWIQGQGWSQEYWDVKTFPTATDLDPVSPHNPVLLLAKSGHAAWVNSQALQLCGITASTPDPYGGHIERDAYGHPTGILYETAIHLVANHIPKPTAEERADWMVKAQNLALASGLTAIHDYDEPSCLHSLQILRERGQLAMRVVKNINKKWLASALDLGIRWGFGDDWLRIGGLKIFADGALGPRTAAMLAPYDGEPNNYGMMVTDKEEMLELVIRATLAGLPATIHAIGDRAVHDVLDVYSVARQQEARMGIHPQQRRHRIEHVQLIHPDDAHRLAELQVIASMQPIHAISDWDMANRYWGERCQWAYNARLQVDAGAVLALGSDSPVEPFHPLKGIHAAVTRRPANGEPWYPQLALTLDEAVRGYTFGPAYAAGMEDRLGKLATGYYADLIVLNQDLTAVPPDSLLEVQVTATMVGGVWRFGGVM